VLFCVGVELDPRRKTVFRINAVENVIHLEEMKESAGLGCCPVSTTINVQIS
jgi:hypothetical protein